MKAVYYQGRNDIRFGERPDPEIVDDRDALVRIVLTSVGALDIAKGKAWTSITFTRNTSDFVKAIKDGTIGAGLAALPGVTPLAGGVVIEAGGSLLGAVGVAGAPGGDKDEACAKAGVVAVQDKLEF